MQNNTTCYCVNGDLISAVVRLWLRDRFCQQAFIEQNIPVHAIVTTQCYCPSVNGRFHQEGISVLIHSSLQLVDLRKKTKTRDTKNKKHNLHSRLENKKP